MFLHVLKNSILASDTFTEPIAITMMVSEKTSLIYVARLSAGDIFGYLVSIFDYIPQTVKNHYAILLPLGLLR